MVRKLTQKTDRSRMSKSKLKKSRRKSTNPPHKKEGQTETLEYASPETTSERGLGTIPYILIIWFSSRLILTVVGVLARKLMRQTHMYPFGGSTGNSWLDIWSAWDANFYYTIASTWYPANSEIAISQSVWAFFPLYPLLTRIVAAPTGNTYIAGLIVSNAAILIGAWFLYKLVEREKDRETARKATLFLFLFPTSYVFSCFMTEGLLITLTIGSWYFARKGNWLIAGILGMGSGMTKLVGLLIAPLLGLEYLRQKKWQLKNIRPNVLWIGLVPLGLVIFMVENYRLTGNPFMFSDIQTLWSTEKVNIIQPLVFAFKKVLEWNNPPATLGLGYGAVMTVATTGMLIWGRRQIGNLLLLWSLAMIAVHLSISPTVTYAMPRYLVFLFPMYFILASVQTKGTAFYAIVTFFILLQAVTFSLWSTGRSFAV